MYERSLNEARLILSTRKVPIVPVREVWEEVVTRSKSEGFEVASLVDFNAMLEGDQRFQIIPAQNKNQEDSEIASESDLVDEEMENLGFFSEDRVRLRIARVVRPSISEDEEEVGSIRRRAFVSQKGAPRELPMLKNSINNSKHSSKKSERKKKLAPMTKKLKRKKSGVNRKPKRKKRGKK